MGSASGGTGGEECAEVSSLVCDQCKGARSRPGEELSHIGVKVDNQGGTTSRGVCDEDLALCAFAFASKSLHDCSLCQGDVVG